MMKKIILSAAVALSAVSVMPAAAQAQGYGSYDRGYGSYDRGYDRGYRDYDRRYDSRRQARYDCPTKSTALLRQAAELYAATRREHAA